MKAIFIRHKFKEQSVIDELWNRKKIGIHFENQASINPEDYDLGGKKALTRLQKYCLDGSIVGAAYQGKNKMLVGRIQAGSKIEPLSFETYDGKQAYLKTVNLVDHREISINQFPVLFSTRPRGITLTGWPSVSAVLESAISGKPLPAEAKSLVFSQMEVLSYEYMRKERLIFGLLLPIGRSLPDIDILGFDDIGNYVAAQVTFHTNIIKTREKICRLSRYKSEKTQLFFFGNIPKPDSVPSYIDYRTLDQVFETMQNDVRSREIVNRMLNHDGLFIPEDPSISL